MASWTATSCSHSLMPSASFLAFWTWTVYIVSIQYQVTKGSIMYLDSFLLGQTNIPTLKSCRNWLSGADYNNALQFFCFLVWTHISFEFEFEFGQLKLQQNMDQCVVLGRQGGTLQDGRWTAIPTCINL